MSFSERIIEYLNSHPGAKAREVGDALGVQRRDVNSQLYGILRRKVRQDAAFGWSVTHQPDSKPTREVDEQEPTSPVIEPSVTKGWDDGVSPTSDPSPIPDIVSEPATEEAGVTPSDRLLRVKRAVENWVKQLIDLSGRNQLLYYRTLKVGTLELTKAHPAGLDSLFSGRTVKLSNLLPSTEAEPERFDDGLKRARTIQRKALAWFEERGIQTLYLAWGMSTWTTSTSSSTPASPVLLRPIALKSQGAAAADFSLKLEGDWQINETLLHLMATEFQISVDANNLVETLDSGFGLPDPSQLFERLEKECSAVPDFGIVQRMVVGTFAYTKLPMVRDLQENIEELAEQDLIAAIAGDEEARESVLALHARDVDPKDPDHIPPADEYLVLDADSSQNLAINAVLAGEPLIVQGPPGTGKSQTIANLITSLVARGKKVLFVAEKRAAIEAVTKRLNGVGLGDLVMDLHGGVASKKRFAAELAQSLNRQGNVLEHQTGNIHHELESTRKALNSHAAAMHERRDPWDLSIWEVTRDLAAFDQQHPAAAIRFPLPTLESLSGETALDTRDRLGEWASLAESILNGTSSWGDSPIQTDQGARDALDIVRSLSEDLIPALLDAFAATLLVTGHPRPASLNEWGQLLDLLEALSKTLDVVDDSFWSLNPQELIECLGPGSRGWMRRAFSQIVSRDYRVAKRSVRNATYSRRRLSGKAALGLVNDSRAQIIRWHQLGGSHSIQVPEQLSSTSAQYLAACHGLGELRPLLGSTDLGELSESGVAGLLRSLIADQVTLFRLPAIHALVQQLEGDGLGPVLDAVRARLVSPNEIQSAFDQAWRASIRNHFYSSDKRLATFSGPLQTKRAKAFRQADLQQQQTTPDRVRRKVAEHAIPVRNANPVQDQLVKREAGKKTRHLTLRRLFEGAPEVLIALRPCWVMSPLVVSQTMPPQPVFDVVVFDEASQVLPADAVPALLRARQAVIAGDRRQLPPTTFFRSSIDSDDEADEDDTSSLTEGFESVLDVLDVMLRSYMLTWHYRSEDERLIAFSNYNIYDGGLTTFPGALAEDCLGLELIPHRPGVTVDSRSNEDEVERIVDLMIEHARDHPNESLGVIGMSMHHAGRIDAALYARLPDEPPNVVAFFDESSEERAFVKNLERVQGDERDAIILSVGYAKSPDGRLPYRFGPLNHEGGERRLNVAVTRARRRLRLVSSFSHMDMEAGRSAAAGVELLRLYLKFVATGGTDLGGHEEKWPLNPFERDVKHRLEKAGLVVIPQHGVSGFRIDFAIPHPSLNGRFVLAVEADGASYHSSATARDRDRLRQQVLERLGWTVHRIWSTDWFNDPQSEVAKVVAAYEEALKRPSSGVEHVEREEEVTSRAVEVPESSERSPVLLRKGERPNIQPGLPIAAYEEEEELVALATWIQSDGRLLTEAELVDEMMKELDFKRHGSRIVATLIRAIRQSQRT